MSMPFGILEAAGFFGIVLVLAVIELVRTRALIRQGREQLNRREHGT